MSANNQVQLIGNLTHDVDHTPAGDETKARTLLKIATNDRYKQDGEWKQHTDYHRVVTFAGAAEKTNGLEKGQGVLVQGKLQTRRFEQDGETRYITEVIATRVLLTTKHAGVDSDADEAE